MKYYLSILLLLLSVTVIIAQQSRVGLRVGPNLTTLAGEDVEDSEYLLGFHAGLYLVQPIYHTVKFEPGLQFATKGVKEKLNVAAGNVSHSFRNSYLEFPLLVRFQTDRTFNLFVGDQPSFLVSSAIVTNSNGNKSTLKGIGLSDKWKEFDCSGMVGVAADLGSGFNLQVNYEHGFLDISKTFDALYNRGFKLSLGKTF